jgi:hypothetical protein
MMKVTDYVYLWECGHVEILDQVYKVRFLGEKPVMIGYVPTGLNKEDASRVIQARRALVEKGVVVDLKTVGFAREAMYGALIADKDELVSCPAEASAQLTLALGVA